MAHRRFAAVAGALLLTGAAAVFAAVPSFWQVATQADFLKGDVENLSIDGHGRLMLGPASTAVYESSAPFLWTMVTGTDGATYVGSGNEGQVYRLDATGKGTVFFDAEELEVHAIANAPGGGLYVGTSPDGKIYKLDAKGAATTFFDPADKYIWALAVDKTGTVFAATGDKGVIYKISPDGKGQAFYETKATHAISLAFDREGRLVAGTESPGRVFQIDANGKPFVLLDSPFNEIHTLRVDANGNIYAAALSGRGASEDRAPMRMTPEPSAPIPVPSVSTEITAISIVDVSVTPSTSSTPPRSAPGSGAGALYRILPDGASDLVWESREDAPYDVGFEPDGGLLVATGNKGKIYRLSGDPLQATLVTRAPAQQVTTVMRDRSGSMLYATANPGKVFRLAVARADHGTYESEVRDARTVATWGAIKWHAAVPSGAKVEVFTRSGNTRTPDDTWSAWSAAYTNPEGSPVTSPRARYLQWRAVLTAPKGESPLLTSVTAAYLQRNLRPRVNGITIHPPGTVFQKPFSSEPEVAGYEGDLPDRRLTSQPGSNSSGSSSQQAPSLGRRVYQKGLMTFVWNADDENNDELQFEVRYRREGETSWKTLKRDLSDPILVWDTTSVPNGTYVLRVVASDSLANPPGNALTGHMDSTSFDIDNAPPTISVGNVRREGGRTVIAFDVRDEHSAVQKVEYSLDGDRWRPIYPKDGISDSRLEQFELVLDGEAGSRGVVIRATDSLNNVSSTRGEVEPRRTQ
jgi:hypothetical protein